MAPRLKFLPYALSKTLFNFQQEGVLFGISKDGRCLIADEMGLGKTLQALSIAYYYKNEWPLLIVCPSSMRFPWIEEIEKWLPDIQPGELNLVQSGTDASNIKTSKISIISYGLLSHPSARLLINCLKDTKFGVVVVDESHYMKNRKTARAKALISVIKNTKRAVLLTGTPALARPEELYVQIDVLKPCLLGSFNKFAKRFCEAHTEYICGGRIQKWNTKYVACIQCHHNSYLKEINAKDVLQVYKIYETQPRPVAKLQDLSGGASNLEELHDILKTNVMIRRLKRHVLKELPPKRRQKITFDLANVESKKQLAGVIKEFRRVQVQIYNSGSSQNVEKNPVFEMQRLATVLYKQTGISKISAVRQYIADMLDNSDKKFLVFAYHVDVMKAIELEVVKKRVKYIRIAGDVPSILRGSLVQQFQKDSSVRVAILSLLAASVGITLTAADHIIFTELHWTPGIMEQAEDRVHRIGQVNSVLVQYLVAKGTIDEVLWRMLCKKVYVTTATLNGKLQGMDVEEGSEGQSKLLEAFSAWVAEDDEEEDPEEDYLFTHSQKKRKQDVLQRSLTEFFHSPSTSKCRKTDFGKEWAESQESEVNESPVPPVDGKPSSLVVQVDLESVVKEEEKDRPKELDILSGYTQLLSKPKLAKANVVNVSVESTGSNKLSKPLLDKPTNQTEIIDLTGEEEVKQYSDNTEPDESDKNQVDTNCVGVEHPRSRACDVIDNDISDFKTNSSWCCGLCTFSNSGFLRVCEVCGTPRHRSRRKLPNTALSTPKFVKRQQQKILKRSVVAEKKMKSFGRKIKECDVSEERSVLDATVRDINDLRPQPSLAEGTSEHEERPNLESQDVGSFIPESPISDDIPEDLPMINPNTADPGDMSSLAALSNEGASDEFMTSSCESAEDVKAAVDELFLPGNEFDELTADAALSNEGASDEFMTSGCESAEDVKAAVDELFLPGNEFDELTADAALSNEGASDEFMTSGCESAEDVKAAVDELFLPGNEFDELTADAALSNEGASDEFMTSGCESAEDVKAAVDELFLPGNEFDELTADAALSNEGASDEFMTSGCESAEDVKAAVDELFLPGNEFDELTADAALSNEGASDEFMTSGCESAEDVKAAVDELFLPGNEFDELTAEDWWRCESCFKYNYDESATVCEVCGYVKTKPSEHLEDLVQNLEEDWWRCEGCGTFHFDRDVTTCEKCDMVAKHDSEDKKCFVVDWDKYGHLFIEDCEGEMGAPQAMEHLMFCVSCYTDRVYLYNENAEPLNCNVSLLDLDASNVENLPNLLIETSNRKQVMRFMRKWKALSERQRRMIRDTTVVFEDPYEAVELVKTGRVQKSSTCRFPSKETLKEEVVSAATEVNGTVRHCKKTRGKRHKGGVQQSAPPQPSNTSTAAVSAPPNPNQRTWIQAIDDSGRPLCMSCKSPVDTKNTACQWDERFCSHKCKQDYQIRVSGSHVREKLFKEEHGVCQRCSLNAHDLYRSLRLLPKAERREHLENTPFLTLPVTLLNKIIIDPKEGMFWEADHVVPVVEGGGECGLDNYRTLCVPCHRDVTEQLRERLKTNKRLAKPAGTPDITTFFNS